MVGRPARLAGSVERVAGELDARLARLRRWLSDGKGGGSGSRRRFGRGWPAGQRAQGSPRGARDLRSRRRSGPLLNRAAIRRPPLPLLPPPPPPSCATTQHSLSRLVGRWCRARSIGRVCSSRAAHLALSSSTTYSGRPDPARRRGRLGARGKALSPATWSPAGPQPHSAHAVARCRGPNTGEWSA